MLGIKSSGLTSLPLFGEGLHCVSSLDLLAVGRRARAGNLLLERLNTMSRASFVVPLCGETQSARLRCQLIIIVASCLRTETVAQLISRRGEPGALPWEPVTKH